MNYARFVSSSLPFQDSSKGFEQISASAVEEAAKGLKDRLSHLMVIIVDHVASQNGVEGSKAVANAMKGMEGDVREFLGFVFFEFGLRWPDDLVALSRRLKAAGG